MRSPGNTRLGCTDQIAVPVGEPDGKRSAGNSKQIIADIDILCSRNGIDDLALLGVVKIQIVSLVVGIAGAIPRGR